MMDEISLVLISIVSALCLFSIVVVFILDRIKKKNIVRRREASLAHALQEKPTLFLQTGSIFQDRNEISDEYHTFAEDGIFEVTLEEADDGSEDLIEVKLDKEGERSDTLIPFSRLQRSS